MSEEDLENLSKENLIYLLKDAKKEIKELHKYMMSQKESAENITKRNNILGKQYIDIEANINMDNIYDGLITIIKTINTLFANIVYELSTTKNKLIEMRYNKDKEEDS